MILIMIITTAILLHANLLVLIHFKDNLDFRQNYIIACNL